MKVLNSKPAGPTPRAGLGGGPGRGPRPAGSSEGTAPLTVTLRGDTVCPAPALRDGRAHRPAEGPRAQEGGTGWGFLPVEGPSPGGLLTTGLTSLPEGLRAPDVPPGGALPGGSRLRAPGSVARSVAVAERDRRHPAWRDLSLRGVQTLARLHSARGPLLRVVSAGPPAGVQSTGHWGGSSPSPLTKDPRTGADRLSRCVHSQSQVQPPAAAGEEPGWPRARHQAFCPDRARSGALQAKAPGIHPDELGAGHALTSAGQSLPGQRGGGACMRPEPLGRALRGAHQG